MKTTLVSSRLRLRELLLIAGVLFLNSACQTGHRSYEADRAKSPPSAGEAPLAVIEFDERGDFWEPKQYRAAEKLLSSKSAPILITYVHGWRHDARPDDTDLKSFKDFLNKIGPTLGSRVCGVFIGWRGASIDERGVGGVISKPAALLSFWNRKKVTDGMAGVPFTNTLWRLASQTRSRSGHSVLIGHSFGGRIVERTLGPAAIAQMNNAKAMPYDLTFLVNPATESLYARQLKLALRGWTNPQPAIVVLAARDDSATGTAWPLAMMGRNAKDRNYDLKLANHRYEKQSSYVSKTVGNDPRQFTHEVTILSRAPARPEINYTARNLLDSPSAFKLRLRGEMAGVVADAKVLPVTAVEAPHQIESLAYWVIPLDNTILSGHGGVISENGIFSLPMSDLISGIIHQVGAIRKTAPIVPKSNPADTQKSSAEPPAQIETRQ